VPGKARASHHDGNHPKKKLSPNAENLTATVTRVGKKRIMAEAHRRSEEKAAHVSIGVVINDWAMTLPPAPEEPQATARSR
jgi:hypothetical protein